MRLFYVILFCGLLLACNNQPASEAPPSTVSMSDSLLDLVVAEHEAPMRKYMQLERMQKQAQAALDSLKQLPGSGQANRIALLDSTLKRLSFADVAMTEWMEGFKYDSLKGDEAARIDYLKIQLDAAREMSQIVLSTVAQADSVLAP